jgi:hypothetical protein
LWLIDHGSTLYFHHRPSWHAAAERSRDPFVAIKDHVLLRFASQLQAEDAILAAKLSPAVIDDILIRVPDDWLNDGGGGAPARRQASAWRIAATSSIAWRRRDRFSRRRWVRAEYTYDYAIVRVVPRVDRGEQVNAGVILSCADIDFLEARIELNEGVLLALDPDVDLAAVRANLAVIPAVCRGGPDAGPIGLLPPRGRFRWLVSPRSTIIQPSPVHTGRTADPAACLERLMDRIVRR